MGEWGWGGTCILLSLVVPSCAGLWDICTQSPPEALVR